MSVSREWHEPRNEKQLKTLLHEMDQCAPHEMVDDLRQKKENRASKLHDVKVQKVIQTLTPCTPEEFGASDWLKKVNARCLIKDAMEFNPVKYVTQMLEQNKLTILLHDMILTNFWREEILPQLLEVYKDPPFCGSTAAGIPRLGATCRSILSEALLNPAVLSAFDSGTDILDFIEYSVKYLQYVLQHNPDHDPSNEPNTIDGYRMPHEAAYSTLCSDAFSNLICLLRICRRGAKLSATAAQKLLHPDTALVPTLMDLLIVQPFRYSEKGSAPIVECVWRVLKEVLVNISKSFPTARQLSPECFQKLKKLTPTATAKKYLGKGYLRAVEIIDSSTSAPLAPPPSLPYHEAIRAEFKIKKEAIVAIHGAMGTFEFKTKMDRYEAYFRAYVCFAEDLIHCCFNCGKRDCYLRCGHCQYAYYCDVKCQKADRFKHKQICDPEAAPVERGDRCLVPSSQCTHCIKLKQLEQEQKKDIEAQKADGSASDVCDVSSSKSSNSKEAVNARARLAQEIDKDNRKITIYNF